MQRFILQQNIERFRTRLSEGPDAATAERIRTMLSAAERQLALLNSALVGAHGRPPREEITQDGRRAMIDWFRTEFQKSPKLAALYDPRPGLEIGAVNDTFLASTGRARADLEGQPLFVAFPDNPDEPNASGVANLFASLREVAETRRPHAMDDQRYDVQDGDGRFHERWWRPVNTPLFDDQQRLVYILHVVDEVTEEVMAARAESAPA